MARLETGIRSIVFALFLVVIFSLGLMKPSVEVGFASLTFTDFIFPVALFGWLIAIAKGHCRFEWRREYWAFAFYFVALTLSALFSVNPRLSFVRLAGVGYLIGLAVLASNVVTTTDRIRLTILVWIAGAVPALIAGAVGIVLFYS